MNLNKLLKNDTIRKIEPDKKLANEFLELSKKDLKSAEANIKIKQFNWALAIAYNSMLYAGRAIMTFKGYKTSSDAHHLGVVQFCAAILPEESSQLASIFNRYRTRRNDVVYGEAESVGEDEAKTAIKNAKKFVSEIEKKFR